MRTLKEEKRTVEVVDSLHCDCCGRNMISEMGNVLGSTFALTGGFDSTGISGMTTVEVDVCEECFMKWVRTFRHPARENTALY